MDIKPPTKIPKNTKVYECETCELVTSNKKDYKKHLLTSKHLKMIERYDKILENPHNNTVCDCGNKYKHYSGLWRHKKVCTFINSTESANEFKMLTNLVLELVKSNTEMQKQLLEVCKNTNNNNNTTINDNKNI